MKTHALVLLLATSAAALVGCSQNQPPADALPIPGPKPANPAAVAAEPVNPLADFSVTPGVVFACDGRDRVTATVTWKVKDPSVATVKIEVDSTTDPLRKTFTAGGATGEAVTGDWVGAGVRFHLVDAAGGKELATYEVTSKPCDGG